MMRTVRHSSRKLVNVVLFTTITALLAVGAFAYRTPLAHALMLATKHQTEAFTEVSFLDVTHLPTQLTAGKPSTYAVRVTSHETATKTYVLTAITVTSESKAPTVLTRSITLQPGQTTIQRFELTLSRTQQSAVVTVSIAPDQQIYFRSKS